VYDVASRRLFTVLPAQSSVTVDDVPAAGGAGAVGGGAPWTFTPMASPGRVAGFPCERSTASDGARTYELCAARGFPSIPLEYVLSNVGENVPFLAALQARGEMPLAVVAKMSPDAGARLPPMKPLLTTIEVRREPVDDARFAVPRFPVTPGHLYAPRALPH